MSHSKSSLASEVMKIIGHFWWQWNKNENTEETKNAYV